VCSCAMETTSRSPFVRLASCRSARAAEPVDREVVLAVEIAALEPPSVAVGSPSAPGRSCASNLVGCAATEALVGSLHPIPACPGTDGDVHRSYADDMKEGSAQFLLHRAPEPLDHGDAEERPDRAESLPDAAAAEVAAEALCRELVLLVGDQVGRALAGGIDAAANEVDDLPGTRFIRERLDRDDRTAERVDDRGDAERAEAEARLHGREIDEPDVMRALRADPLMTLPRFRRDRGRRTPARLLADDALDARPGDVQAEPREDLRDAPRAPGRLVEPEEGGDLADEVGKPVHRAVSTDDALVRTIEVVEPSPERSLSQDEDPRRLPQRQAIPRPVPEDPEALPRRVPRPVPSGDLTKPGAEEVVLGFEARDLAAEGEDLSRLGPSLHRQAHLGPGEDLGRGQDGAGSGASLRSRCRGVNRCDF